MSYSIRLLLDEELGQANVLYRKVYGKERSDSFFKWEFLDGPAGKAIYVGAFDGDKLIGTQSAIPIYFSGADGKKILTAKSEDTLLDPEYRGKGLFDKMYGLLIEECKKAGICSIWGFTYAKKPFLKIGFQIPFDSESGVYVIHPLAAYTYLSGLNPQNKFKEKTLIAGMSIWSAIKGGLKRGKKGDDIILKGGFSGNAFLEDALLKQGGYFKVHEDFKYINWRIKENPYPNDYNEFVILDAEKRVVASLIFNIRKEGLAYIEQLLFHPSMEVELKHKLIKHVISVLRTSGKINLIRFWGFSGNLINSTEVDLLKACGFLFVKKGTGFVYLPLSGEAPSADKIILSRLYTQGNI